MKTVENAVHMPKSIPPQFHEAAIDESQLTKNSTTPSIESASTRFNSSIESQTTRQPQLKC